MGLKKPTRRRTTRQGTDVAQGQAAVGVPRGTSARSHMAPREESRRAFGHACRETIESLELRLLMSVTKDANGWTVVTPNPDPNISRVVYVSSSTGSNSNTGLSPSSPLQTIQ